MDLLSQPHSASDVLLATALGGDPEAYWQLAEKFRPYLKGVAHRLLANRLPNKVDASDVVQQSLFAAFEQLAQFQGQTAEQWHAWVLAIVRNQARNLLRYWNQEVRAVGKEKALAPGSGSALPLASDASTPSQKLVRREQVAELMVALQRLPADYQQVLQLRNFEDLPYAEVAVRMNRSEAAVRQLWTRAIRQLREEMGGDT